MQSVFLPLGLEPIPTNGSTVLDYIYQQLFDFKVSNAPQNTSKVNKNLLYVKYKSNILFFE